MAERDLITAIRDGNCNLVEILLREESDLESANRVSIESKRSHLVAVLL